MGVGKNIWILWAISLPIVIALCVASQAISETTAKPLIAQAEVFKIFSEDRCPRCCSERHKTAADGQMRRLTVRLAPSLLTPDTLSEFNTFLEARKSKGAACLDYPWALHVIFPVKTKLEEFAREIEKRKGFRAEVEDTD